MDNTKIFHGLSWKNLQWNTVLMWPETLDLLCCLCCTVTHSVDHIVEQILGEVVSAFAFCRMHSEWLTQQRDIMHLYIPDVATPHPPLHRPQYQIESRRAQKWTKMYGIGHSRFFYGVGQNQKINGTNRKLDKKLQINLSKHYGAPKSLWKSLHRIQDSTGDHTIASTQYSASTTMFIHCAHTTPVTCIIN